jgi:hypothetical protein
VLLVALEWAKGGKGGGRCALQIFERLMRRGMAWHGMVWNGLERFSRTLFEIRDGYVRGSVCLSVGSETPCLVVSEGFADFCVCH